MTSNPYFNFKIITRCQKQFLLRVLIKYFAILWLTFLYNLNNLLLHILKIDASSILRTNKNTKKI